MCVIAVCKRDAVLSKEIFEACFEGNSHGAGFAWVQDDEVYYRKGFMVCKKAWKFYQKICHHPHVAHFRLTSSGGTCKELTHPFVISDNSPISLHGSGKESVLFHNGTVLNWKLYANTIALTDKHYPKGKLSDSRVMAMMVSRIGEQPLHDDGGKYVIASVRGFYLFGDFEDKDGIRYSNTYWDRKYGSWQQSRYGTVHSVQAELPVPLRGSTQVKTYKQLCEEEEAELQRMRDYGYYGRYYRGDC